MKSYFYYILFVFSLFSISGCGDNESDNENMSDSKHISKIIEETKGIVNEYTFTYDSNGRVVELIRNSTSSKASGTRKFKYQYNENVIFKLDYYNDEFQYKDTFYIENGKVIEYIKSDSGTPRHIKYSYNEDDYLYKYDNNFLVTGRDVSCNGELVWKDGNLDVFYYFQVDSVPCTYSDYRWNKGMVLDFKENVVPSTEPILLAEGYFGKLPKNLPSKVHNTKYEYTISGGYVTKIVKETIDPNKKKVTDNSVMYYTWEYI